MPDAGSAAMAAGAIGASMVPMAGAAAIGASMAAFAASAASGGFAVNETGGQALLTAIRNMKDRIDEMRLDVQAATYRPPLGTSHGANVMTTVDAAVVEDNQGFMPMLLKFRESLEAAEQGINDAMRNYATMDERGAARQQST